MTSSFVDSHIIFQFILKKVFNPNRLRRNLIRAIENVGIATSYVVQYYSVGSLNTEELIQFLQAQAIASEYLEQASNFSPKIKKEVKRIQETDAYKKVAQRYEFDWLEDLISQ